MNSSFFKDIIKPRQLVLVDGVGAFISAILIGLVLVYFYELIGIPKATLYWLAAIPCLFVVHALYQYRKDDPQLRKPLQLIAIGNILYCFVTAALIVSHSETITIFGVLYFIVEIAIIISLSWIELRVANTI